MLELLESSDDVTFFLSNYVSSFSKSPRDPLASWFLLDVELSRVDLREESLKSTESLMPGLRSDYF